MTKNIIIGVLAVSTTFFVILANMKAREAEKQAIMAELNLELALENEAKAYEEQEKAVEAAAKVRIVEMKAEELKQKLEACR